MSIRIIVADDHQLMREGLASMLAEEADLEVVGQAENGTQAIDLVTSTVPDIIVLDIAMPDLNGIDAARTIHSRLPGVKIIALSMHTEHRFVVDMMKAGAAGYLPKSCAFEELGHAIRSVHSGRTYLSPAITGPVLKDLLDRMSSDEETETFVLSPRERQVLQLVAEGKSSKEIAADLHVSMNTVIRHRQHIMDKLDIHTVAELTRYAIREGLSNLQ